MGIFRSIFTYIMLTWMWIAQCVFQVSRKNKGKGICIEKYVSGRNLTSTGYGYLVIFLEQVGNS